jgi:hypothetical protein
MMAKNSKTWRFSVVGVLAVAVALGNAGAALAAGAFKAVDHDWVVGVNAETLHRVPSGGKLPFCASQHISAITPSITYSGARVGERYKEEVIGPKAAGTIVITSTRNIDDDVRPLKFTKSSGTWDNTYAIMSFPGSFGHPTLPPGTYTFEVLLSGTVAAKTAVTLVARAGC